MKRLSSAVCAHTRSKRPRLVKPLQLISRRGTKDMVSASHVYNYMINDPLIDWLKLRHRRGTRTTSVYSRINDFTQYIQNRGVEFETQLVDYLNSSKATIVTVSDHITDQSCQQAIKLMKQGVPILHSVPVRNRSLGTQGIIDLLVRSDKIGEIIEINPLTSVEQKVRASKLKGNYHYVVIDIKFSTLPLRADGIHLLNSGHYPAYKAQTLIYTQAIGRIQGYVAPYAFILGRRWRYTQKAVVHSNDTCLDRLGKIDFNGVDSSYLAKTANAIKWVREVKAHGASWSISPPSRQELYPNMCVDSGAWQQEKQKIATSIGELTSVWHVGVKHRNRALLADIRSWRDPRCTTIELGLNGRRAGTIDRIMAINRQSRDLIWPKKIRGNRYGWKDRKRNEFFVDFETLADIFSGFDQLPRQEKTDMIFMIGVGWEEQGDWHYRRFTCNSASPDEEYRIMDEFNEFLQTYDSPKLHHWYADQRFWDSAERRQFGQAQSEERKDRISDHWGQWEWSDMCKLFQSEPIVIKDCFKFGLKAIASTMYKHKMVATKLDTKCNSGMFAMVNAWKCYQNCTDPATSEVMRDIGEYNEFDCKILWEILSYLRTNHT